MTKARHAVRAADRSWALLALATLGIKALIEWRTIAADAAASGPTQENRK